MRHLRKALLALLVLLAASRGVGQAQGTDSLLDRLPADTQVIYGLHVQQVLASPFGQFLFAQLPAQNPLTQMSALTGFDLRRDLQEMVVASFDGRSGQPLVRLRGVFPRERFLAVAKLSGATSAEYRGITILTTDQKDMQGSLALLDSATLAFGPPVLVNALIDHGAAPGALPLALADRARVSSTSHDVWFATVTPLASLLGNRPDSASGPLPAALLQGLRETSGGLQFTADTVNIDAEAVTKSASDAQTMATMLTFVARMSAGPQLPALKNASFAAEGPAVRMTLSIPEQELERMTRANSPTPP